MFIPRSRLFWSVGIGHLTNDMFVSMGPVILAFISASLVPMTNTQVGLLVSAGQIVGALSQPFFGLAADRRGGRWLASGGLLWLTSMMMVALLAAQLTGQYWLVFLPYAVMVLGSGALHPVGALHAAESEPQRVSTTMSYFFLMGQVGLGLGPALAGILIDLANPASAGFYTAPLGLGYGWATPADIRPFYIFGLFALPGILLMATTIPSQSIYQSRHQDRLKGGSSSFSLRDLPLTPFAILVVMITLRGLAQPGSVNFLPILFREKGWSPAEYGLITSSFWLASAFAGVLFGELADRYDRRWIVMVSMVISAPAFFLLPSVDGLAAFLLAIAAGGFSGGSHSIIVVLAQEMMPSAKGFASGTILGFIFGTGALGSLVIGRMSDAFGLTRTFEIVAVITVISGLIALFIPLNKAEPGLQPVLEGAD